MGLPRRALTLPFACAISLLAAGMAHTQTTAKYPIVDGHFHYLNFVQETAGMEALFQAMNDSGVVETMISGMPLIKKWDEIDTVRPRYYMDNDSRTYWYSATDCLVAHAVQKLSPEQRRRVHPFICGLNAADRNAAEHVERMLLLYPGLWEGIGEVFARHDDLTALTYGETARCNSKSFDRLLDMAAKHNLPVILHSDIGPAWLQRPDYLSEFEYAVKTHPDTTIIWAHAGISRRIVLADHTKIIERMLRQYNNLRVDLSWVIFDQEIAPNGILNRDWVALIEDFPDRFIIGSDTVGFFEKYKPNIQRYYLLLDALKPDTAQKVAHDNFLSVLPANRKSGK